MKIGSDLKEVLPWPAVRSAGARERLPGLISRCGPLVAVIALAVLLLAPRGVGPIDLRWDAGICYLLGTSLATGQGYRIPSEPGSPEALQYPPLLPAIVALHQWALQSTDPAIVAPLLRKSYAALFVVYACSIFVLTRRYLSSLLAVAATAVCLFQFWGILMPELVITELPFAVACLAFVIFGRTARTDSPLSWPRELLAFIIAAAAFLLRTAGAALFIAWILEALIWRRWRLAFGRCAMALVPIVCWQGYVERVRLSDEYRHPAYAYQRAPYLFYNVSYAENAAFVDPFRPELGKLDAGTMVLRLATNLASMPLALGETVSTKLLYWNETLQRLEEALRKQPAGSGSKLSFIPRSIVVAAILGIGILVALGLMILARRGEWLLVLTVLASCALMCTTPWPGEFPRYLAPIASILVLGAFLALLGIRAALRAEDMIGAALRARGLRWVAILGRFTVAALLVLSFAIQVRTARRIFVARLTDPLALPLGREGGPGANLFFHDESWRNLEEAAAWIKERADAKAIVATTTPHYCYLRTGLRAVLPPMDSDVVRARGLLAAVPVSYLIVDELDYFDVSRRYALPAVESDPEGWRLVQSFGETHIYERFAAQH
ncbi:MAG: hypothetical protein H0U88_00040 [Chthoniobacterales bacterium]|nr:hypothetical protein [Chthoniobacterales bacterium]